MRPTMHKSNYSYGAQRGAALIVGLVMLAIITLLIGRKAYPSSIRRAGAVASA